MDPKLKKEAGLPGKSRGCQAEWFELPLSHVAHTGLGRFYREGSVPFKVSGTQ